MSDRDQTTPGDQHGTDQGGFDHVVPVAIAQAVETPQTVASMVSLSMELGDQLGSQNIELARTLYSSSLVVLQASMTELVRPLDDRSRGTQSARITRGDKRLPRQPTE